MVLATWAYLWVRSSGLAVFDDEFEVGIFVDLFLCIGQDKAAPGLEAGGDAFAERGGEGPDLRRKVARRFTILSRRHEPIGFRSPHAVAWGKASA